ncbi:thioredoxin family protein [Streptomyces noursei]|uniref:thioredoxin family protein n=1 Tax=Streptomyces noursei TaxID=1971 RepID=UPI0033EA7B65
MPTTPIKSVTEQTFPAIALQADRNVLIQFWAPWCRPCRRVTPVVEELAADHRDVLDVVKVNVDEEPALAARHGISSIPAFTVYTSGTRRGTWTGAAPKPVLEQQLASCLR